MAKPVSPIKRIDSLYNKCLDLIEKEVAHLTNLAIVEKLSRDPARDLRDIIKLLDTMKDAHAGILAKKKADKDARAKELTDDEIEASLLKASKANKD